jgi:hypothetical protein
MDDKEFQKALLPCGSSRRAIHTHTRSAAKYLFTHGAPRTVVRLPRSGFVQSLNIRRRPNTDARFYGRYWPMFLSLLFREEERERNDVF